MDSPLTRQSVIELAFDIAVRESVEAVTLTRVARELGVSQPALYRYVAGIDELLRALTLHARQRFTADLRDASVHREGKTAVKALARAWRKGGLNHPSLLTLPRHVKIQGDGELEASVERIGTVISATLVSLDLDDELSMDAALLIRSLLHGFTTVETGSGRSTGHFDKTFEYLVALIWEGLQGMESASAADGRRAVSGDAGILERGAPEDLRDPLNPGSRAAERTPRSGRLNAREVVEAASRIVDEQGLTALSLTGLARNLGVRQPALYRHVEGIQALYRALALHALRALLSRITQAAIGRTRDDALRAVAVAWRGYVHEHPGTYSSIPGVTIADDPELQEAFNDIVQVLTLTLRGYTLSEESFRQLALCLHCGLHGFCLLEKDGGYPSSRDIEQNFARLITVLIAGVRGVMAVERSDQALATHRPGRLAPGR